MIQKILNLFRQTPKSEPIDSFNFPTGNSKIYFPENWQIIDNKKSESTFAFFNEELDGILYASELTNEDPEYQYTRQRSLEINSDHAPELVEVSKYGAVLHCIPDEPANVTYKYYEIGFGRTLLQFTWMTPFPDKEDLNKEIELILWSAEIE